MKIQPKGKYLKFNGEKKWDTDIELEALKMQRGNTRRKREKDSSFSLMPPSNAKNKSLNLQIGSV